MVIMPRSAGLQRSLSGVYAVAPFRETEMARQWCIFIEFSENGPNGQPLPSILLADELFGDEQASQWHRARGSKRMLRVDPRWRFLNYYEVLHGFATNDPAIADRFIECLRQTGQTLDTGT
jgi:hypothetical protein